MELYRFDAAVGRPVLEHGSRFVQIPLTSPEGGVRAGCFHLPPGGGIGRHEAGTRRLLCVVTREGWVSGPDGDHVLIAAGLDLLDPTPDLARFRRAEGPTSPGNRGPISAEAIIHLGR